MANATQQSEPISVPKGGGAMRGMGESFSPDLFTGTANFTIPISLPAGRNGFHPTLTLAYSTGNGNGPFGLGWAVSLPRISRKTSQSLPRYGNADTFVLSGFEDLVPVSRSGTRTAYRPRTEGLFARIERVQDPSSQHDYWEVATKDGLVSRYGTPGAVGRDPAAVADPRAPSKVFTWQLAETVDAFGNRIVYDYRRDRRSPDERTPARSWDQLYLERVRYVDYENGGNTRFLFSVEFCYDPGSTAAPLGSLVPPVQPRPDHFSEYRSTFEIRTRYRCALIVVRTHPANSPDVLVRAYRLIYLDERTDLVERDARLPLNGVSLLSRIDVIGYDDAGSPSQELPPIDFSYSQLDPDARRFTAVLGTGATVPSLAGPHREIVDLHGAGLPDIVELSGTARYWRNLGGGTFAPPRPMREAPLGLSLGDRGVALLDADGDGRTDLLVHRPDFSAAFALDFGPRWKRRPAVANQAPPFELSDPEVKLIDLDGDGAVDALRSGTRFECFFADSGGGWSRVRTVARARPADFPNISFSDPRIRLADMTGDGLQDIVFVHDGGVDYWPNLGYGDWGARISMERSPRLPAGYAPSRLLLGDLDGDGLADLVYVDARRVHVWFNCCGNRWSAAVDVAGTPSLSAFESLRIVDLHGNGTSGVLFSSSVAAPGRESMYFLDLTAGTKPYLLTEMDANLGATTRIEYSPSTRFFLDDEQRPASRWRTPLPFPVQVVSRVEVVDRFSRGKLTTEYRYHNGYWDGAEREFRGFGTVEQFDSESFATYHAPGRHAVAFRAVSRRQFTPPTLTRTWFHQGPVGDEHGAWSEQDYSNEFWREDPELLGHQATMNARVAALPRRAGRDALRALRGSKIRIELYALDGSPREHRPYTVTEVAYDIREESRPAAGDPERRRVFFPFQTAERTTQWERGDDPLTVFTFTADYDDYGFARQQTRVAMPRRSARRRSVQGAVIGTVQPDETRVLAAHELTDRARPQAGGRYIHDRIWQVHGFELATPPTVTESAPDDVLQVLRDQQRLARRLHQESVDNLRNWAPGSAPPASLSLVSHTINHFDGNGFAGRGDGQIDFGALTRTQTLVFTAAVLDRAFAGGGTSRRPAYLGGPAATPAGAPAGFGTALGYQYLSTAPYQAGWYSDTRRRQFDFQTIGPAPAGWTGWPSRGMVVATQDGLGGTTTIELDPFWLLTVRAIDAVCLDVRATYNYRVAQPDSVTDVNGNTTRVRFTPHGLPAKLWTDGGTESKPDVAWTHDWRAYFRTRASADPQPASVRTTQRIQHAAAGISDEVIESLVYSDGFGRTLQQRSQAADIAFGTAGDDVGLPAMPGAARVTASASSVAARVTVSGWQVYNNKGVAVEKYEAFFDAGWAFQPEANARQGAHVEMFYDPRGNVVRTLGPDGSQQRVINGAPENATALVLRPDDTDAVPAGFRPTPWEAYNYDSNDLAPISVDAQGRSLAARAPAAHHFTPMSTVVDALGHIVCHVERNGATPASDWLVTRSSFDIQGNTLAVVDALGRQTLQHAYDLVNRSLRTESLDAGLRTSVPDARGNQVEYRNSNGACVLRTYDVLNRPLEVWVRDEAAAGSLTLRERTVYGDEGSCGQPAADRYAASQLNLLGKPTEHWDEAGVVRCERYDIQGNLLAEVRRVVSDATLAAVPAGQAFVPDWSRPNSAAALDAVEYRTDTTFDAMNRVTSTICPQDVEGTRRVFRPSYNRAGDMESVTLFASTAAVTGEIYVAAIAYNARRQRVLIEYGNGLMTRYAYEPDTFRLARVCTERIATPRTGLQWAAQGSALQDFTCLYDLTGNVVAVDERVRDCGIANSVDGRDRLRRTFEYDPCNRLLRATGRACVGTAGAGPDLPNCGSYDSPFAAGAPAPTQSNAPTLTQPYTQSFAYDPVGNLLEIAHDVQRPAGTVRAWVRRFGIAGRTPANWTLAANNQLTSLAVNGTTFSYAFDNNGNLEQQNLDTVHVWNHADRMSGYRVQAGGATSVEARYLYDSAGGRVKKWVRRGASTESTVYVDEGFEHHRSAAIQAAGGFPAGENNTLHVLDGQNRVALVRLGAARIDDAAPGVTYQLADHLGGSAIVIDAQGAWTNREEFFPFGETSFGAHRRKRYRFVGRERDDETSLQYYGSRYCWNWCGRWVSCDPAGPVDGPNLYAFARNNPLSNVDRTGRGSDNVATGQPAAGADGGVPVQSGPGGSANASQAQNFGDAACTACRTYNLQAAARKREMEAQVAAHDALVVRAQQKYDATYAFLYSIEEEFPSRPHIPLGTTDDPVARIVQERIGPRPTTSNEEAIQMALTLAIFVLVMAPRGPAPPRGPEIRNQLVIFETPEGARPMVQVVTGDGNVSGWYRSIGQGGQTAEGQWVRFHGVAETEATSYTMSGQPVTRQGTWIIKNRGGVKLPAADQPVSRFLENWWNRTQGNGMPVVHLGEQDVRVLNEWLRFNRIPVGNGYVPQTIIGGPPIRRIENIP